MSLIWEPIKNAPRGALAKEMATLIAAFACAAAWLLVMWAVMS